MSVRVEPAVLRYEAAIRGLSMRDLGKKAGRLVMGGPAARALGLRQRSIAPLSRTGEPSARAHQPARREPPCVSRHMQPLARRGPERTGQAAHGRAGRGATATHRWRRGSPARRQSRHRGVGCLQPGCDREGGMASPRSTPRLVVAAWSAQAPTLERLCVGDGAPSSPRHRTSGSSRDDFIPVRSARRQLGLAQVGDRVVDISRCPLAALSSGTHADPAGASTSPQLPRFSRAPTRSASSRAAATPAASQSDPLPVDPLSRLVAWLSWVVSRFDRFEPRRSRGDGHPRLMFEIRRLRRWHLPPGSQLTADPRAAVVGSETLHPAARPPAEPIAPRGLGSDVDRRGLDPLPSGLLLPHCDTPRHLSSPLNQAEAVPVELRSRGGSRIR